VGNVLCVICARCARKKLRCTASRLVAFTAGGSAVLFEIAVIAQLRTTEHWIG
jgi:hypothetical protein